jgi:hypothetical protein
VMSFMNFAASFDVTVATARTSIHLTQIFTGLWPVHRSSPGI